MGKGLCRVGDKDTGHSNYAPTAIIEGSSNVLVNGKPAARQGDALAPHGHPRFISGGSSTVFINGKPAARKGDDISCGGKMDECSPSVNGG